MPDDRLYLRGRIWWAWLYDLDGARHDFSTQQRSKAAARHRLRDEEQRASDPAFASARATLSDALKLFLDERTSASRAVPPQCSAGMLDCWREKAAVLVRLFEYSSGAYTPLSLDRFSRDGARLVDAFISQRRAEWSRAPAEPVFAKDGSVKKPAIEGRHISDSTIHKELTCLFAALKLSKRHKLFRGDLDAIRPTSFSPSYVPRRRRLHPAELSLLLGTLTPDHAARVAFIVASSAEWIATERARDEDVALDMVEVRGSKNANRARRVGIVDDWQRELLEFTLKHARGKDGQLFAPWGNVRRDLHAACARVGIEGCSPNDLRRTFATWHRIAGRSPADIAPMMGHADSTMVERVYGKLEPAELAAVLSQNTAAHLQRSGTDSGVFGGLSGLGRGTQPIDLGGKLAPWPGLEPGTRGLTVRFGVLPTPSEDNANEFRRTSIAAHLQLRA